MSQTEIQALKPSKTILYLSDSCWKDESRLPGRCETRGVGNLWGSTEKSGVKAEEQTHKVPVTFQTEVKDSAMSPQMRACSAQRILSHPSSNLESTPSSSLSDEQYFPLRTRPTISKTARRLPFEVLDNIILPNRTRGRGPLTDRIETPSRNRPPRA